ncbi:MAG: ATP-binding cassette subfamily B protein, partial [Dinoroseobacter sp.]
MDGRGKAKLLWQVSAGYRLVFLAAIVSMAVGYLFMFGVPLLARLAIDVITSPEQLTLPAWFAALAPSISLTSNNLPILLHAALLTVLLTGIAGICLYFRGRYIALASEGIVRQLRDRIYSHLEHLPSRYHDKADTGDLVQRCSSDMETVRVFLAGQVIEISRTILMLIIVLPILFSLDTNMAWLSLSTMPILFIFAVIFFQRVKSLFLEVDESEARMTTVLQENLTGIRVVRAFARQEFEADKFAER